ncbi:MAG: hypothetical protein FJY97_08335 [candidate division Zixibacteria bacterium]|nr:hypothetical protein [candidate division Zixibacteria bacterium]
MYRFTFLVLTLCGLLAFAFGSAQAERSPAPMTPESVFSIVSERAAVSAGTPLTDTEMRQLVARQGCFGIGSTNCCKEGQVLIAITGYLSSIAPNVLFATALLIGNVHQIIFCQ